MNVMRFRPFSRVHKTQQQLLAQNKRSEQQQQQRKNAHRDRVREELKSNGKNR